MSDIAVLTEQILNTVLNESHVDVRFDFFEKDQWAFIGFNDYDADKEFAIRLHNNGKYDVVVGRYDDEDEFHESVQPLTEKEIVLIPDGLRKVMTKVVSSEDGLRVPSSLLTGKKN